MSVKYHPIDGESVSGLWLPFLLDAREDGVPFVVGEGHRTKERQAELVREKGLWSPSNPTGAAPVSDNAPHIWTGRPDHAIDFGGVLGVGVNAARVVAYAAKHGVILRRPIAREPWHVVPDRASLERYNARRAAARKRARRALKKLIRRAQRKVDIWRKRRDERRRKLEGLR